VFRVKLSSGREIAFRFETFKLKDGPASHVTNCYVQTRPGGKFEYRASAFCSRKDTFSWITGKSISLHRVMGIYFSDEDRRRILAEFAKSNRRDQEKKDRQAQAIIRSRNRKRNPRIAFVLIIPAGREIKARTTHESKG